MASETEILNSVFDSSTSTLKTSQGTSTSSSTAVTQVASSASSVTLLAANTSRKEVVVYNDSTQVLYVKYGTTASTSSYTVQLNPGDTLVEDRYNGRIDGIWASANGNAYVTEVA